MVVITSATSGRTFETINPANGNVLATVQAAGREDVDRAVKSAQQGQNLGSDDRYGTLAYSASAVDILRERNDELANWKPSTPEKHIPKPQPSISLPVRTCWSTMPG